MFISDGFTLLGPEATGRSCRRFQLHHKFPTADDLRGGGALSKSTPITNLPASPDSSKGRWRMINPEISKFDNRVIVARLDRNIYEAFWASSKAEGVQLRARAKLKGVDAGWLESYPRIIDSTRIDETSYQLLKDELRTLHQAEDTVLLSLGETNPPFINNVFTRALIGLNREGIHPAICDVDPDVIESLEVKKLDKMCSLFETEEVAVKALQGSL
jgi:anti-anti-sigma regulatory factor